MWYLTLYVNVLAKVSVCLVFNLKGFSAGLFAFYRDDDGKPLTTRYADGLPPFNERYFIFLALLVLFRVYSGLLKIQLYSIIRILCLYYVETLVCGGFF